MPGFMSLRAMDGSQTSAIWTGQVVYVLFSSVECVNDMIYVEIVSLATTPRTPTSSSIHHQYRPVLSS